MTTEPPMTPEQERFYLEQFQRALKESPERIHWPTPAEPWLSFETELVLIVPKRRRQGVIYPSGPLPEPGA